MSFRSRYRPLVIRGNCFDTHQLRCLGWGHIDKFCPSQPWFPLWESGKGAVYARLRLCTSVTGVVRVNRLSVGVDEPERGHKLHLGRASLMLAIWSQRTARVGVKPGGTLPASGASGCLGLGVLLGSGGETSQPDLARDSRSRRRPRLPTVRALPPGEAAQPLSSTKTVTTPRSTCPKTGTCLSAAALAWLHLPGMTGHVDRRAMFVTGMKDPSRCSPRGTNAVLFRRRKFSGP